MSGIERRAGENLDRLLSLTPKENDPHAGIPLTQALDEAYLALHSPVGMTPEKYRETLGAHSKRLLGALDSFVRGVVFETYRVNRGLVFLGSEGSNSFTLGAPGFFSSIRIRKDGDSLESFITFAKHPKNPDYGWEYRLDLKYDSDHEYYIGSGETVRMLKVEYMKPHGPDDPPVDQEWKFTIENGEIAYMEKNFGTFREDDEEPEEEYEDDSEEVGDSQLPPGSNITLGDGFNGRKQIPVNRTVDDLLANEQ